MTTRSNSNRYESWFDETSLPALGIRSNGSLKVGLGIGLLGVAAIGVDKDVGKDSDSYSNNYKSTIKRDVSAAQRANLAEAERAHESFRLMLGCSDRSSDEQLSELGPHWHTMKSKRIIKSTPRTSHPSSDCSWTLELRMDPLFKIRFS